MTSGRDGLEHLPVIVLMVGVSGSGKSTIGTMLADRLDWPYAEGDDFHSARHKAEMAAGRPLTDQDRWPWLDSIAQWIDMRIDQGSSAVVSCSAIKRSYRRRLCEGRPEVRLAYLYGSHDLITARLSARRGHFFTEELLASQFRDFEEPTQDEHPYVVSIEGTRQQAVDAALEALDLRAPPPPRG